MCTMAMDNTAMTNVNVAPTSTVAEAGSREAPALPPGLLTEMNEAARPTKLFIGGISRHTTTKQLRDHFAQFGRVLDCVAMRQPDGRPRGFGYVTLDSPSAAEACLREPQNIDNRIVDMKLAVPEGSGSYGTSPKEANFNMNMFAGHGDFNMDMYAGHGFNGWPDASDTFGNPWWNGASTSPHGQGLDCLELLRSAGELAVSQCSSSVCSPHGLPLHSVGLTDYGECAAAAWEDEDEPTGLLIPAEFQKPAGAARKMSAGAQEFVPMSANAPEFVPAQAQKASPKVAEQKAVGATPVRKAAAARAPLGELNTNVIMEVTSADLLKPFKSPTNKLNNDVGSGHLIFQDESPAADTSAMERMARPTGLLLDDEDSDAPSPGAGSSSDSMSEPEAAKVETTPDAAKVEEKAAKDEGNDETDKAFSDDVSDTSEEDEVVVDMDNLPSLGSAAHATGECKRCNFFPKGRCSNGKNCQFCHFPHDKRKPSRQEKRERRAAWMDQNGMPQDTSSQVATPTDKVGPLLSMEMPQHLNGPLLSKHGLHQGGFPVYPEDELYRDETLAYSIFPGMPPIHATKLPAPLPLPGMVQDMMGPALPPGLVAPALSTQPWQPESSGPRALAPFLSTVPTPLSVTPASTTMSTPTAAMASAQAGKTGPALPPGLLEAEVTRSLAPLATEPTPTSAMSTPTAAMAGMFSTSGTQTGDYKCLRCEVPEIGAVNEPQGRQWAREELLQLRDSLMKLPQASEQSSGIKFRTQAIVASASN